MLLKHWILTKRNKSVLFFEILNPCITSGVLYGISRFFVCDMDPCTIEAEMRSKVTRAILMPMIITLYVPNISSVSSRFIIQSLVEDK
jgi:hypothetical protein